MLSCDNRRERRLGRARPNAIVLHCYSRRHTTAPRHATRAEANSINYVVHVRANVKTSLPKVIWEEGRVAALSHTYAVKSPLVTMAWPIFAPKSTPSRRPIPKPHYLLHSWTRPTYDAKRHPDQIRRFATMHWTDRPTHVRNLRTDRQIVHGKVCRGRCARRDAA